MKAYAIARSKLSGDEKQWLDNTYNAGDPANTPLEMAEDARQKAKSKQWTYTNKDGQQVQVRGKIERCLRLLDNYARIVDIGIQHSPEIT